MSRDDTAQSLLVQIARKLADPENDPVSGGRLPNGEEWVRCPFCGDAREGHDLKCPVVLARMWKRYDDDRSTGEASERPNVRAAALRLLRNVVPFGSALAVKHVGRDDGEELYGDLAEALGLPRDWRGDDSDGP